MSDQYQVLTYRVQRNEGQKKLQRVVVDADAHRVDLRGQLRLTEEVKVDMGNMEQIYVTLSPTPAKSETMPVVMGVVPESDFMLDYIPSHPPSMTLGLCSSPTRHLAVENDGMTNVADKEADPSEVTRSLRSMPSSQTSTHEELATVKQTQDMRKAPLLPMADLEAATTPRQGRVIRPKLRRPSWEKLNLRDEAPAYHRPRKQSIMPTLFLLAAVACTGAAIWLKYTG